ncbi:hypothetical protein GCM10023185_25240 [Hymenobacter saemangeumensis]|uniref:DUF1298 domain-containing protein n=2 Tax=Hymenobacter saemangeumensis TaxID=1084522 RepID=A0ABP8IHL9_9BACT
MLVLPPVGLVSLIGQGNRAAFDPDASSDAAEMLQQVLFQHDAKLHLTGLVKLPPDSSARKAIARNTLRTVALLESRRKATMAQPQPWLDSLLMTSQQRYCLVSCVWGFTRTPANRRAMVARDLGIGLLSMGMLVPVTPSASVRLGLFIYDAQTSAIVYHKANFPTEKDPLAQNGEIIYKELTGMLGKDFNLTAN